MSTNSTNFQKYEPIDVDNKPKLSPDELLELMGRAAYNFENANRYMKKIFKMKKEAQSIARVAILSKDFNSIGNSQLKNNLIECFKNEKYKPTLDDLENFIYLETKEISEEYDFAEFTAKQSQKEYEMWYGQLVWYMSLNKLDVAELNTLGVKK